MYIYIYNKIKKILKKIYNNKNKIYIYIYIIKIKTIKT